MTTWDGMPIDPEQHMVIVRSEAAWTRQLRESFDELTASCGGELPARFVDAQPRNPAAFGRFVEAYFALTGKVDEDVQRLAGLVPVDQALME